MSKMNHLVVNLPLVYLLTFQFVFILAVTQRWTYASCNHATYFCQLITLFSEVTKNPNLFGVSLSLVFLKKLASIGRGNTAIVRVVVAWSQRYFGIIVYYDVTSLMYHNQPFFEIVFGKSLEEMTLNKSYIYINNWLYWSHINWKPF